MAFIKTQQGRSPEAGYFLESETGVVRKTRQIPQSMGVTVGDSKIVPMGTVYPSNDGDAEGLVYEDVDVSWGDGAGAVALSGRVFTCRLPEELDGDALDALKSAGFRFIDTEPEVTRPY